ncbi:MAG TPA: hypothetical protein VGV60_17075 [Candidatus Polarisedimenticolia bacterium]|nr:hypothetical protein [Candidatus Polarisedimenticolia bacterium]
MIPVAGIPEGEIAGAWLEGVDTGAGLGAAARAAGLRRAVVRAAAFFLGRAFLAVFFRRATFLADALFAEDLRAAFFRRGDLRLARFLATVSPPLHVLLENDNQYITRVILCQDGETGPESCQLR